MDWYIGVIKKYADFKGRARRKEYWMYWLFYFIFYFAVEFLEGALDMFLYEEESVLGVIYTLGLFIPSLAVTVRRLHDTNHSGWWQLIGFIPFANIILFIFLLSDSDNDENKYGPNPKKVPNTQPVGTVSDSEI